jgi:hypothetical protein
MQGLMGALEMAAVVILMESGGVVVLQLIQVLTDLSPSHTISGCCSSL